MNRRISILVATGFAILLGLGVLANIIMMAGLDKTVARARASQASALDVRAAVRSLRADYLQGADVVSHYLIDPSLGGDGLAAKQAADKDAERHLASATLATRRSDLVALLQRLRAHDARTTNHIEERILRLAGHDAARARRLYVAHYLPARAINMQLVDEGLRMASEEVMASMRLTEREAADTLVLAWVTLGLFALVGTTSGVVLSRAVRSITTRFEVAAEDVTEQRDHLQAVMTAMQDVLIVVDASGIVTTVNDAACTLLGWKREELIGSPIARFVEVIPGAPDDPAARNDTVIYRARDGVEIPMAVSAATMRDANGTVGGIVRVAHDMRAHLHMLAEVAAARDAALEGSQSKSEFLANVSHEIRTPMNVVIGYIDILLESSLTEEQQVYLTRSRFSAVALLDIINDVLDISKVEAGKLTVERVPFGLDVVVGEIVQSLMLRAQEKGLVLEHHIDGQVPERVVGDPTRLRQVILNLVSNAIKFTEAGEVRVRVCREGESTLHFAVSDTGIGIPEDKQDLIFEAFTQADGSMSRRFGGTGLGLTIAARLVGLMGGRIWVESELGCGSVFHFTIETGLERDGLAA